MTTAWRDDLRWYCLRIRAQREFHAERKLRERGHHAYCPVEIKMVRRIGREKRRVPKAYPLCLRYAFIGEEIGRPLPWLMLLDDRYRDPALAMIQGVIHIGGSPGAIPASEMQRVFANAKAPTPYRGSVNPHVGIILPKTGDNVEIMDGPFAGRMVKIEDVHGHHARIILELFGGLCDADVPLEYLEVA